MASYLEVQNITKFYGPKVLFENISFNINEGDKIALIAPNGTGKTSLMRILAGNDKSDSGGKILFLKDIRIAFLEQEYDFDPEKSVLAQASQKVEDVQKLKEFLTNFRLGDLDRKMKELSGGEVKRVALSEMLASGAEFFIMDEPTNHLDADAIEYLESYLSRSRCTLLMVTHDRYFLDRVCNIVMEMDHGAIYTYRGNYQNYLEKRDERIANYNAETDKVRNLLRRELEWIHATPCARTGKAKYRIDAFYDLKERSEQVYRQGKVSMDELGRGSRLGSKIINCKHLSCHYGEDCYLDDFTYNFNRFDKVGIVGRNGVGKTTFINLLTDSLGPDAIVDGVIERGESLKIGYYRQTGMRFNEDDTVLDIVGDMHLLNMFLFPHDMFTTKVNKLSGGEKRRLYLLTILMQNPNLLILDEPTNDLDIVTINILEEYLKEFKGSLIIVSHDRHFLDRLVDHLLVFCGDGVVKDFIGNFSEYRAYLKDYEAAKKAEIKAVKPVQQAQTPAAKPQVKKKLTWKEQREFEQLEADLEALATEKAALEEKLSTGDLPFAELQAASSRIAEIIATVSTKEDRWLELSEFI